MRAAGDSSHADRLVVAVTAEALEEAAAAGLPCRPIAEVVAVDQMSLTPPRFQEPAFIAWLAAIGRFETALAEAVPTCRFSGPGILTGQMYPLAFAVNAVRYRAGLLLAAVKRLRPTRVTVIETRLEPWAADARYIFNPWHLAFSDACDRLGLPAELVWSGAAGATVTRPATWSSAGLRDRAMRALRGETITRLRVLLRDGRRPRLSSDHRSELRGLRILFSDMVGYDWAPVYDDLADRGAELAVLESDLNVRQRKYLALRANGATRPLRIEPRQDEQEASGVDAVFAQWAARTSQEGDLTFDGIETFRPLEGYVRRLADAGPTMLREADAQVRSALDEVRPHAVCGFAFAYFHQKRLVHECQQRGIPQVCFQHGGAYGTHYIPTHAFIENAYCDYFLAYGGGIVPRAPALLPRRARYVANGSTRLDAEFRRPRKQSSSRRLRVIWAGDFSTRNVVTAGTEIEDTTRFALETSCLATLEASRNLDLWYRPFPGQAVSQGTQAWCRRNGLTRMRTVARGSVAALLRQADLCVTISTSGTLWAEAFAVGIPLVAFTSNAFTVLDDEYVAALSDAALVCRTGPDLVDTVRQIAEQGRGFLDRFAGKNADRFLRRFAVHEGRCAERAREFLVSVARRTATPDAEGRTAAVGA